MKKMICSLLAALLLTACGASAAGEQNAAVPTPEASAQSVHDAVAFTDALGREVVVNAAPQRVATLIGSFADIWCLAGGRDSLVATAHDSWTSFELGLDEGVADLGAIKEPSVEKLLAAAPELVIASANTAADVDLLDTLEGAGLNVVYFNVSSFGDYLAMLKLCTEMTGCPALYAANGESVLAQVDAAKAAVADAAGEMPRVLYLRASGSSVKVKNSADSVLGEMLADFGCQNIADSDTSLLEQLSMEAILAADPDKIFIVVQGSDPSDAEQMLQKTVLSDPAWQQLTAVQTGQVHYMDQSLYNLKPNAKWGLAYENLAQILTA